MCERPALSKEIVTAAQKCLKIVCLYHDVQMGVMVIERVLQMELDGNRERMAGSFDWTNNLWKIILRKHP
jgi:hypothetical protein